MDGDASIYKILAKQARRRVLGWLVSEMPRRDPPETRLVILISMAGGGALSYVISGSVIRAAACALGAFVFIALVGFGIGVAMGLAETSRHLIRKSAGMPTESEALLEDRSVLESSAAAEVGVDAESGADQSE